MQGGGPVITVSKFTGDFEDAPRELHAGGSYLFGFAHDNGFFTEFRVGGGNFVPQLKLGRRLVSGDQIIRRDRNLDGIAILDGTAILDGIELLAGISLSEIHVKISALPDPA